MNRGPIPGSSSKMDALTKARLAWGEAIPPEVIALAEACQRQTQRAVGERLGYSDGVISSLLHNKYQKGDMPKAFAKIRGAFMGETVMCPVHDEISKDRCVLVQGLPFSSTNPQRVRAFYECKTCPNRQQKDAA